MVQYIFRQAFQLNKGGLAAAASVVLFLLIIVMSVLQYQLLRARGAAMTAAVNVADALAPPAARRLSRLRHLDVVGLVVTLATLALAIAWAFPLYWGVVTTFKHEYEIVKPGIQLWPADFTFENYVHVLLQTKIGLWYINSLITSGAVTVIVVIMAASAGYAISQLRFPGRTLFWWMIMASFMVPIPALIVNHFILMAQFGWVNTLRRRRSPRSSSRR